MYAGGINPLELLTCQVCVSAVGRMLWLTGHVAASPTHVNIIVLHSFIKNVSLINIHIASL